MQDETFINVHQMYGWKKATALGERFVAKNILEERDPAKIFKLLKALARRNVPQSTEDLVYWMFCVKSGILSPSFRMSVSTT